MSVHLTPVSPEEFDDMRGRRGLWIRTIEEFLAMDAPVVRLDDFNTDDEAAVVRSSLLMAIKRKKYPVEVIKRKNRVFLLKK